MPESAATIEAISQVLQTARNEIGVREVGNSNTGERVQQYQAATTLGGTGWPWCAAFIAWVMKAALGSETAAKVWLMTASCDLILDWATRNHILHTEPRPGAACLVMAGRHDATHVLLVDKVFVDHFTSIEGNTNDNGSREGNGVYSHWRANSTRYLFVYWMDLLPQGTTYKLLSTTGNQLDTLQVIDGTAYVAAWKWAQWQNAALGWDITTQTVNFNGIQARTQTKLIDGRAFIPIRVAAAVSGLGLSVDNTKREIHLEKG